MRTVDSPRQRMLHQARRGWMPLGAVIWVALAGAGASLFAGVWDRRAPTFTLRLGQGPVAVQEAVTVAAQVDAAGEPTLKVSVPAVVDGQAVTQAVLPTDGLATPSVGHLPEGWTSSMGGGQITLSGPSVQGPALHVRLDLGAPATMETLPIQLLGPGGTLFDRAAALTQLAPLQVVDVLQQALHFPWTVAPGETVTFQAVQGGPVGPQGTWSIGGTAPQQTPPTTAPAGGAPASGPVQYQWQVPSTLTPGAAVSVTGTNAFGQTVVNVPNAPVTVAAAPPASARQTPTLRDCTPRGFVGRVVCLCGWFPGTNTRDGFTLSGQPLQVVAASSMSVLVQLPANAQPGTHDITGDPARGFAANESIEIQVLAVRGTIDQDRLRRGQTTPLRLEVLGTTDQLDIVLTNHTPAIVNVAGGIIQVLQSSGGTPNNVVRQVQGITPGAFDIGYQLAGDPCPCAAQPGTVVAGNDPPPGPPPVPPAGPPGRPDSTIVRPPPSPGDSTVTGPPTGGDPTGETRPPPLPPVPPIDPPAFPPPEDDDQEDPCCGFRPDGTLTYPKITDPLVPADVPVAPRSPAVGAFQVLLHSGAYFHNELDLEIDAVGFPFRFARHYKGDVETVEGGVLGNRWDFSLNKRIVPQAVRELGTNMMLERPVVETPQLWYFDGQGRGALYNGVSSEWREVLNFGQRQPFRAWVTTYEQRPGDFYEIQRYVLEDPAAHPFAAHPNVDDASGEAIFYVLRERNGLRYVFNCRGQLLHTLHRNDWMSLAGAGLNQAYDSVRMTFEYEGDLNPLTQNFMLSRVEDASGHVFAFETTNIGQASLDTNLHGRVRADLIDIPRLERVEGLGRRIRFIYQSATGGPNLVEVVDSVGTRHDSVGASHVELRRTGYAYDASNRLESVTSPKQMASARKPYLSNHYDGSGRVTEQRMGHPDSANVIRQRLTYAQGQATVVDAAGTQTRYELTMVSGLPVVSRETIQAGSAGSGGPWTTTWSHNVHTQVVRMVEPRGNVTELVYDGQDNPVTEGWLRNRSPAVTYQSDLSAGNLLRVTRLPGSAGPGEPVSTSSAYDPLYNQLAEEVDARGTRTTYSYAYQKPGDFGNYLEKRLPDITRPSGLSMSVPAFQREFDPRGLLIREHMEGEREKRYSYDNRGYLVREEMPGGAHRTFSRNAAGLVLQESGTFGTTAYVRGPGWEILEIVEDPNGLGNRTTFAYDLDGDLIAKRSELKDNFAAGSGGPTPSEPRWVTESFHLDILGRTIREQRLGSGPAQETSYVYDAMGRLESATRPGPRGQPVQDRYQYGPRGALIETRQAVGTSVELVDRYQHDANGNTVRHEQRAIRDPSGGSAGPPRVTTYEYDGLDRRIAIVDPLGARTEVVLDAGGNVEREQVVEHAGGIQHRITEWTYDELGNQVVEEAFVLNNADDRVRSEVELSSYLERARTVGPAGGTSTYLHDAAGRVTRVVTPAGDTTRTTYDAAGRPIRVDIVEVGTTADTTGRDVPSVTRRSLSYEYDALGRVTREVGQGHDTRYFYDSFGNQRGVTVNGSAPLETVFDGLGREQRRSTPKLSVETRYGPSGLPVERIVGSQRTRWTWDEHGQMTSEEKDGALTRIDRDALGNPVRVTDPNGTVVTTLFNEVGLPVSQAIEPGQGALLVHGVSTPWVVSPRRIDFEYDILGQTTLAGVSLDPNGQPGGGPYLVANRQVYDGVGRLELEEQEINGRRYVLRHGFASNLQSVTTTYPTQAGALEVTRETDVVGRLQRVSTNEPGLGTVATYTWAGADRVSSRIHANAMLTRYHVDAELRLDRIDLRTMRDAPIWEGSLQYGQFGLTSIDSRQSVGGRVKQSRRTLNYDRAGRPSGSLVTHSEHGGVAPARTTVHSMLNEYRGGALSRTAETLEDGQTGNLIFARSDAFQYDTAGRRSSLAIGVASSLGSAAGLAPMVSAIDSAVHASSSRLTGSKDFLYDNAGNLVSDGELVYSYDHAGRLTRVLDVDAAGGEAVFFTYDAFGRRVMIEPRPGGGATGLVQWSPAWHREPIDLVYDGRSVIAEFDINASAAAGAPVRRRYILGARPGERVRADFWDGSGSVESLYPHEGLQGEILFVTDANRQVRELTRPASAVAPGLTVPDDLRYVSGSTTRAPYLSWTTRSDGFAGTRFDERSGGVQLEYRSTRALADSASMQAMRGAVSATQTRGALTMAALTTTALSAGSLGAMWTAGLTNLSWSTFATPVLLSAAGNGLAGAGFALWSGDQSYGLKQYMQDVGEGAVFGLFAGLASAARFNAVASVGFEGLMQTNVTTGWRMFGGDEFFDAYGASLREATLDAVAGVALLGVGKGVGMALGARLQRQATRARAALAEAPVAQPLPTTAGSGFKAAAPSPSGNFRFGSALFDQTDVPILLAQRSASRAERELQQIVMHLMDDGTPMSRIAATAVRRGRVDVVVADLRGNWAGAMGVVYGAHKRTLFLNSRVFNPNGKIYPQQMAATIVHEVTHLLGAGELSAHVAHLQFMSHLVFKHLGTSVGFRKVPWVDEPDYLMDYWAGRASGRFDQLARSVQRTYHGKQALLGMYGREVDALVDDAGGFFALLGMEPVWAWQKLQQLDGRGWFVGHPD